MSNIDLKALRGSAEAAIRTERLMPIANAEAVMALFDQLDSAERRAEEAEKGRDEAIEEVRLLSAHCNGLDEQFAVVEKEAIDRAAAAAWSAVMDECKERGISPSSRAGSGWFKVIDAIRSLKNAVAEPASKPLHHGVDAEASGGGGMAQETAAVPGTNSGHGHAWARPDGVKMRCGGVQMCGTCAADWARAQTEGDQ